MTTQQQQQQPDQAKAKGAGPGRASTSCTECQRRKQKVTCHETFTTLPSSNVQHRADQEQCDKQWPCRHCQDRRVPHLCQFKKRSGQAESVSPGAKAPSPATPMKRKIDCLTDENAIEYAKRYFHAEGGLDDFGYAMVDQPGTAVVPSVIHDNSDFTARGTTGSETRLARVESDLFPPRPYADVLIHNFIDNINYVYCMIHPSYLLADYDNWWRTRRTNPDIPLESLLFRLCSISAQFLPEAICERLEQELNEDIVTLKQRWHEAAEKLHAQIRPGDGGVKHVQQLILTASFYKTEAMFIESWHALSSGVRIAQELGLHKDSAGADITEFELEVRREVWIGLYTWDRLMAFLFDRPPMIFGGKCSLVEPKVELHQDPINPDMPSPLFSRIYEFRLAIILDKFLDQDLTKADLKTLVKPLRALREWFEDLPPLFSLKNPDTRWDERHHRIPLTRLGLHTSAYLAMFHILRPCLTNESFPADCTSEERERLRAACIEYTVRTTDVVDKLTSSASHARFHMSFCLFETSVSVCEALVKDERRKLPQRERALRAIGRARNILDRLGPGLAVARSSAVALKLTMDRLRIAQPDTAAILALGQQNPLNADHSDDMPVAKEVDNINTNGGCKDSALGSSVGSPDSDCEAAGGPSLADGQGEVDGNGEADVAAAGADSGDLPAVDLLGGFDFSTIGDLWDWENFDLSAGDPNFAMLPLPEVH